MEELSLGIFIVPTIALILVILGYRHFAKRVSNKKHYRKFIVTVGVVAFVLNFIWELIQGPLYKSYEYDLSHISFCGLASVADMLMVFLLLFGFGLINKEMYWMQYWSLKRMFLLVLVGFCGAILAEVWHTARGDWAYADTMPLLPIVNVGISPVIQFTVLPWLIFWISIKFIKDNHTE